MELNRDTLRKVLGLIKRHARRSLRVFGTGLYHAGLARLIIRCSSRTRTVLYHAVEDQRSSYTKGLGVTVSKQTFELHLDFYQRYYTVTGMTEYLEQAPGKQTQEKNRRCLLITFDDGYSSVMDNALPLLEARGMSATVYLIGNAVRGRMVWVNRLNQAMNVCPAQTREVLEDHPQLRHLDRRQLIHYIQSHFEPKQISALIQRLEDTVPELADEQEKLFSSPEDIRQMQKRGIEFGFHTNDHWNLGRCKDSELASTLDTQGIEELITSNTFAYPFGYFARSSIGHLTRQGYQRLMTVGSSHQRFSKLHMNRVEVFETSRAAMFARLEIEEPVIAFVSLWRYRIETVRKTLIERAGTLINKPVGHSK